jgi:uncharacterized protein YukE
MNDELWFCLDALQGELETRCRLDDEDQALGTIPSWWRRRARKAWRAQAESVVGRIVDSNARLRDLLARRSAVLRRLADTLRGAAERNMAKRNREVEQCQEALANEIDALNFAIACRRSAKADADADKDPP